MEPFTVAIIGAVIFGSVVALSAFIRQLIISRDKKLNDKAIQRALKEEMLQMEQMRHQMSGTKRFDAHYDLLGSNKDAIAYLDNKIEEILQKKFSLIDRYSQVANKESCKIFQEGFNLERKAYCTRLKDEMDSEVNFYNNEIVELQKRRASLWDTHAQLQERLIEQEAGRNKQLDDIYLKHTGVLEKIFLRSIENNEEMAKETLRSGENTFKMMVMAPINFLKQLFKPSDNIFSEQMQNEIKSRKKVAESELEINGLDDSELDEDLQDSKELDMAL